MALRRFPRLRRLLRILVVILLTTGLAEAALRLAGHLYLDRIYRVDAPHPGDITVLCLGESSTAGLWVDPADSYPRQLERGLRQLYALPNIRVAVPPDLGQNTSQIANRIDGYLNRYRPRLVVVMAGCNNEWSLAESHIGRFLKAGDSEFRRERARVALDSFRLFRLFRYGWARFGMRGDEGDLHENSLYVFGHPESVRYPPGPAGLEFSKRRRDAFVALWRYDLGHVVDRARARAARVLLMTYPINPVYLGEADFLTLAEQTGAPLVRNDRTFQRFIDDGTFARYVIPDDMWHFWERNSSNKGEILGRDALAERLWHPNRLGYRVIARNALTAIRDRDLLGLGAPRSTAGIPLAAGPEPLGDALVLRIELASKEAEAHLGLGWSRAEGDSRWTDGPASEVLFNLAHPDAALLRIEARAFLVPGKVEGQRLRAALNGRSSGETTFTATEFATWTLLLPAEGTAATNVLRLGLPDAAAPAALGVSPDDRRLGLDVRRIEIGPVPAYARGSRIALGAQEADPHLGEGWSRREDGYRWSEGPRAEVFLRTEDAALTVLRMELRPFVVPGKLERQRLSVVVNGKRLATLTLREPLFSVYPVALPTGVIGRNNVLSLELPDARSPASLGVSADPRVLGIALRWLALESPARP